MNVTFKPLGGTKWSITDTGITYGSQNFSFSEITDVKLNNTTNSRLINGVIIITTNYGVFPMAFPFKQKEDAEAALQVLKDNYNKNGEVNNNSKLNNGEFRKRCNVCGTVFCYTNEDLKKNASNALMGVFSSLGAIGSAVSGRTLAAQGYNASSDSSLDKIKNYDQCPNCGSRDLRDLTDDEWAKEQATSAQGSAPATSAADELKKFKELLDSGIITQEEFDAKKKQLLGL